MSSFVLYQIILLLVAECSFEAPLDLRLIDRFVHFFDIFYDPLQIDFFKLIQMEKAFLYHKV